MEVLHEAGVHAKQKAEKLGTLQDRKDNDYGSSHCAGVIIDHTQERTQCSRGVVQ